MYVFGYCTTFEVRNFDGFCIFPVRPVVFFVIFHKKFVGPLFVLIILCYIDFVSYRGLYVYVG